MTAMPACWASAGPWKTTGSPSSRIRPESGLCTPANVLTRVDLPAPFSPARACTSPARSSRLTPASARTAPNALLTSTSARTGAGSLT